NRREALRTTAGWGLAALAAGAAGDTAEAQWIDAHSHVWPAETDKYPLVAGLTKRDLDPPSFTPDELMAVTSPAGLAPFLLIQHSNYHLFDNRYLIDVVTGDPARFRVVGMVDDTRPDPGSSMRQLLPNGVTGFRITPFIRKENAAQWLDN